MLTWNPQNANAIMIRWHLAILEQQHLSPQRTCCSWKLTNHVVFTNISLVECWQKVCSWIIDVLRAEKSSVIVHVVTPEQEYKPLRDGKFRGAESWYKLGMHGEKAQTLLEVLYWGYEMLLMPATAPPVSPHKHHRPLSLYKATSKGLLL